MDLVFNSSDDKLDVSPLVIIVQGSPRGDGNCAALAVEAFNACQTADFETIIVSSADLMASAQWCNGCLNCVATGLCIHEDDVATFIDMLDEASGLLWITPIYFSTVPACLKSLIDRMQIFWARREREEVLAFEVRRPAAAVIVGSGADPFGVEAAVLPLKSASNIAEFTLSDPTVLLGLDENDAILQAESADKRAAARTAIEVFIDRVLAWQ